MAFSFWGTFTTGQFEVFKAFTNVQKIELRLRQRWLEMQLIRIGKFITTYNDSGSPISFVAAPNSSYGAKLLQAYKILGGMPERDMLLRTRDMPVFLTRAPHATIDSDKLTTGGYSDIYSNGRRYRGTQRFDRDIGVKVDTLKKWQLEAIKHKREKLEYKIKRALDMSDQIQEEIDLIDKLLGSGRGSVSYQIQDVDIAASNPLAGNVVDDMGDRFGLNIGNIADKSLPSADELAKQGAERLPPKTGTE